MTFSAVEICNMALSDVPAKRIVSLDDTTVAAEACKREFTQAVEELMEMGEWGFARRRAILTPLTDTRPGWAGAFAQPNDMAFPIRIVPVEGGATLPGRSLPFDFADGVIWSHSDAVALEYVTKTPAFSKMTAMFRRGLATVLASRIVMDITRDPARKAELMQEAEVWRDRALARNLNANATQQTYGENFIPSSLRGYFESPGVGPGAPYKPSSDPEYGQSYDFAAYVDSLFD